MACEIDVGALNPQKESNFVLAAISILTARWREPESQSSCMGDT